MVSGGAPYIAVAGPGAASPEQVALAEEVGALLAARGALLICGGLGGVMEAACRGAAQAGGVTVGLLPGEDRGEANEHVAVALATGLGQLRNGLLVRAADALIAIGGAYGTLSEIALALRAGLAVIGLDSWAIEGVVAAGSAEQAVSLALEAAAARDARG